MYASILLIDDNPEDRKLAIRELQRRLADVEIIEVADAAGFDRALGAGNFDLVITDYQLRWGNGLSVLRAVKERYPFRPVIFFTASGNEEIAVEAMKAGLDDYVTKSARHFGRLPLAARGALELHETRIVLQTLYRMTAALNRATTLEEVCDVALSAVHSVLKVNRSAVLLADDDHENGMRFCAWRNISDEFRHALNGFSPWPQGEGSPARLMITDLLQRTDFPHRGAALAEGLRSVGFIPILLRDQLEGIFLVAYNSPHYFRESDVNLVQNIATHVAFAVARI
jgi:CheY-like chemotaxis protein